MNIPRMNVHRPKSHSGGMPAGPQPSGEVPVSEWTNQVGSSPGFFQFDFLFSIRSSTKIHSGGIRRSRVSIKSSGRISNPT